MLQGIVQVPRYLAIICCCVLGFVTIVATGGGGGGVDVTPTPAPPLATVLDFSVSAPTAAPNDVILSASFQDGEIRLLQLPTPPTDFRLTGTHVADPDPALRETTLNPPGFIQADTGPTLFGILNASVTATVRWVGTNLPIEGAMQVDFVDPDTQDEGFVTVTVVPDAFGAGNPGVSLQLSGDAGPSPTVLTWDQFLDLTANPEAPSWQVIACLGYGAYDFLFQRLAVAFDNFQFFVENDTALETVGAAGSSQTCDVFPPSAGSAGARKMVWNDLNASGDLNGGDGFTVSFTDCWQNDPFDDIDQIFRGELRMVEYIENADPLFLGGDFIFTDFSETETDPSFQEDLTSRITTNGRFTIHITEAQP